MYSRKGRTFSYRQSPDWDPGWRGATLCVAKPTKRYIDRGKRLTKQYSCIGRICDSHQENRFARCWRLSRSVEDPPCMEAQRVCRCFSRRYGCTLAMENHGYFRRSLDNQHPKFRRQFKCGGVSSNALGQKPALVSCVCRCFTTSAAGFFASSFFIRKTRPSHASCGV